jgi:hypothetical protein
MPPSQEGSEQVKTAASTEQLKFLAKLIPPQARNNGKTP